MIIKSRSGDRVPITARKTMLQCFISSLQILPYLVFIYSYNIYLLPAETSNAVRAREAQRQSQKLPRDDIWCAPSGVLNFGSVGMFGTAAKQYFVPAAATLTQLMGLAEFQNGRLYCKARLHGVARGKGNFIKFSFPGNNKNIAGIGTPALPCHETRRATRKPTGNMKNKIYLEIFIKSLGRISKGDAPALWNEDIRWLYTIY